MKIVLVFILIISTVSCVSQEGSNYRDSISETDRNAKALVDKMQRENPSFDYVDHYNQRKEAK